MRMHSIQQRQDLPCASVQQETHNAQQASAVWYQPALKCWHRTFHKLYSACLSACLHSCLLLLFLQVKDALKAAVLDDTLTISGKRTKEKHEEGPGASKEGAKAPLRYERSYDIFSRSFWSAPQRGC